MPSHAPLCLPTCPFRSPFVRVLPPFKQPSNTLIKTLTVIFLIVPGNIIIFAKATDDDLIDAGEVSPVGLHHPQQSAILGCKRQVNARPLPHVIITVERTSCRSTPWTGLAPGSRARARERK